jgi:hypothetical protein
LSRRELLAQIEQAEMELIDEFTGVAGNEEYAEQFERIQNRCGELSVKYPGQHSQKYIVSLQ